MIRLNPQPLFHPQRSEVRLKSCNSKPQPSDHGGSSWRDQPMLSHLVSINVYGPTATKNNKDTPVTKENFKGLKALSQEPKAKTRQILYYRT